VSDFGINVVCYRGDYHLAQACCASIRDQIGSVPICLFVDGDFDVTPLVKTYGIQVVHRHQVRPELREHSYGYGFTKMVMFWHSPFERFLYVEADAVVWGNVLHNLSGRTADFIVNDPHERYSDAIVRSQYFDPDRLFDRTAPFAWRERPLFNTGVLAARRGLFDLDEYLALVRIKQQDHSLLACGDQGILNVMVFRGAEEGRWTVETAPLQTVVPVVPRDELERRFAIDPNGAAAQAAAPTVVHWAGAKPSSFHAHVFRAPMMHYRLKAAGEIFGRAAATRLHLMQQDWRAGWPFVLPADTLNGLRRTKTRLQRHVPRLSAAGVRP
jgi:hypothetical protein